MDKRDHIGHMYTVSVRAVKRKAVTVRDGLGPSDAERDDQMCVGGWDLSGNTGWLSCFLHDSSYSYDLGLTVAAEENLERLPSPTTDRQGRVVILSSPREEEQPADAWRNNESTRQDSRTIGMPLQPWICIVGGSFRFQRLACRRQRPHIGIVRLAC